MVSRFLQDLFDRFLGFRKLFSLSIKERTSIGSLVQVKLTFDVYSSTSTDTFDKGLLVAEGKLLTPVHEPRLDS